MASTLIKKVPIGICECGKCGQTVYEHHYQGQWGVTVIPRRFVHGHNGNGQKLEPSKDLYGELLAYKKEHSLSWQDLATHLGIKHGTQLSNLPRHEFVTAKFARRVRKKLQKPLGFIEKHGLVEAEPIYELLLKYKDKSGSTWLTIAKELDYQSIGFIYQIRDRPTIRYSTASNILSQLARLEQLEVEGHRRVPSQSDEDLLERILAAEREIEEMYFAA